MAAIAAPTTTRPTLSAFDVSICDKSNRAAALFAAFGKALRESNATAASTGAVISRNVVEKYRNVPVGRRMENVVSVAVAGAAAAAANPNAPAPTAGAGAGVTDTAAFAAHQVRPAVKQATVNRTSAPWDVAYSLIALFDFAMQQEADRNGTEAAVSPPPLAYTMSYMVGFRCTLCGECTTERTMIVDRNLGLTECRELPLCPGCVRYSVFVDESIKAQAAVPAHVLRGDAAIQHFLHDADGFVITSPHILVTLANSRALEKVSVIRFACPVADVDLHEIGEHCCNLQHLVLAAGTNGNPEALQRCLSKLPNLKSLLIATGPGLALMLGALPTWETNIEELSVVTRRRPNGSDASTTNEEIVMRTPKYLERWAAAPQALPSLRRINLRAFQSRSDDTAFAHAESPTVEHFERLAASPFFASIEDFRYRGPLVSDVERATNAFQNCASLRKLHIRASSSDLSPFAVAVPNANAPQTPPPLALCPSIEVASFSTFNVAQSMPVNDTLRVLTLTQPITERRASAAAATPDGFYNALLSLPKFSNLRSLALTSERTCAPASSKEAFDGLGSLTWLETVMLNGDFIAALAPLSNCSHLRTLVLCNERHTAASPAPTFSFGPPASAPVARAQVQYSSFDLLPLTKLTNLKTLALMGLAGEGNLVNPDLIRGLAPLAHLELWGCGAIGDDHVEAIVSSHARLEVLTLRAAERLSNTGLLELRHLRQLRDLTVVGCAHVTAAGLAHVAEICPSLASVALEGGADGEETSTTAPLLVACAAAGLRLKYPESLFTKLQAHVGVE